MAGTFPWRLDTVLVARAHARLFPKTSSIVPVMPSPRFGPILVQMSPTFARFRRKYVQMGVFRTWPTRGSFSPWEQNLKRARFGANPRARHFQIFWGGGSHKLRGGSTEG